MNELLIRAYILGKALLEYLVNFLCIRMVLSAGKAKFRCIEELKKQSMFCKTLQKHWTYIVTES